MTELTDPNFIATLRMHFLRSKSTLDSLKSVTFSMYVGGNRRWVAAMLWRAPIYFTFPFPTTPPVSIKSVVTPLRD